MTKTTELDDPPESVPLTPEPSDTMSALPMANRPLEVEAELQRWLALGIEERRAALRSIIRADRSVSPESLVHLCRRAYQAGDRQTLNLAFEALAKRASPLLLSQARGLPQDERAEQAQQVLLELFAAIQQDKAHFAECRFAAYAKRKAISLYRSRRARFEGAHQRLEATDDCDPLDDLPARIPSLEARALLHSGLDKLPPKHRAVFIQYHLFEMTQDEIAFLHDVTVRTVYSWRKKAEAALGMYGDDHDR